MHYNAMVPPDNRLSGGTPLTWSLRITNYPEGQSLRITNYPEGRSLRITTSLIKSSVETLISHRLQRVLEMNWFWVDDNSKRENFLFRRCTRENKSTWKFPIIAPTTRTKICPRENVSNKVVGLGRRRQKIPFESEILQCTRIICFIKIIRNKKCFGGMWRHSLARLPFPALCHTLSGFWVLPLH